MTPGHNDWHGRASSCREAQVALACGTAAPARIRLATGKGRGDVTTSGAPGEHSPSAPAAAGLISVLVAVPHPPEAAARPALVEHPRSRCGPFHSSRMTFAQVLDHVTREILVSTYGARVMFRRPATPRMDGVPWWDGPFSTALTRIMIAKSIEDRVPHWAGRTNER